MNVFNMRDKKMKCMRGENKQKMRQGNDNAKA